MLFPNINEDVNCKFFLWLRRFPNPLAIYSNERNPTRQEPSPPFAWTLYIYAVSFSQSLINTDTFHLYYKALILKHCLILSITNTKIWSKKSIGPFVAKMFFLQSRQMKASGSTGVLYKNV